MFPQYSSALGQNFLMMSFKRFFSAVPSFKKILKFVNFYENT